MDSAFHPQGSIDAAQFRTKRSVRGNLKAVIHAPCWPGGAQRQFQPQLHRRPIWGWALTSNSEGTDHGWTGHQSLASDAVAGCDVYGTYPVIGTSQANDVGAVTLSRWIGLSDGQPGSRFPTSGTSLPAPVRGLLGWDTPAPPYTVRLSIWNAQPTE